MSPLLAALIVLGLGLLLVRIYSRGNPRRLVKGMGFSLGILLALATVALAMTGRIGFAFLTAGGAWFLLMGSVPPWMGGSYGQRSGGPEQRQGSSGLPSTTTMSRAEALKVLGLEAGASRDAIRAAHRRLIQQIHPDKGGTNYLAAKINEAKDVLLSGR